MSNNTNDNSKVLKIFTSIRCLSKDQLPRYLDGRLTDVEKHLVEQHLADCDLCFEAMRALEKEPDFDRYQQLTGSVQRYVHQHIQPVSQVQKLAQYTKKERKKENLLVYFWLVAFAVLGVGSVYVLRGHIRNQPPPRSYAGILATGTDSPHTAPAAVVQELPANPPESSLRPVSAAPKENKPAGSKPAGTDSAHLKKTPPPVKKPAADSVKKTPAAPVVKTSDSLKKEPPKSQEPKPEVKKEPAANTETAANTPKETPPAKAPEKEKEKEPPANTSNDEYLYKAAMVYQQQGDMNEAISRYKRLSSSTSGKYAELARYQMAVCYRNKGQMGKARRMFREVVRMEGSMKGAAQQALDNM